MMNFFKGVLFFLFAISIQLSAATISGDIVKGQGYSSVYLYGETIPTSSYIEKTFYGVGGYDNLSVYLSSVSAGSITTANAIWVTPYRGVTKTLKTDSMYADGRPYRNFKSDAVTVRIYSNQASTVKVTGNILLRTAQGYPKRIKAYLKFSVGTTSTTLAVTPTTQGNWFIRSDQKIHINWGGATATTGDFFLNQYDALDTGVYFSSGDVLKMIAATTTANVSGYSYE